MNPLLIGPVAELLNKGLDRLFPDPQAKAAAQLELVKLQQEGEFREQENAIKISLAQAEINKVEAASQNGFQAGWRPLAGYVCVLGMGVEFILRPLLPWVVRVYDPTIIVPDIPSLDSVLWELMFGMLGLGALRTADRWKRNNVVQNLNK